MCLQKFCKPTFQVIHVNEMQFHCSQTEGEIIAKDRREKCVNCCSSASNYEATMWSTCWGWWALVQHGNNTRSTERWPEATDEKKANKHLKELKIESYLLETVCAHAARGSFCFVSGLRMVGKCAICHVGVLIVIVLLSLHFNHYKGHFNLHF